MIRQVAAPALPYHASAGGTVVTNREGPSARVAVVATGRAGAEERRRGLIAGVEERLDLRVGRSGLDGLDGHEVDGVSHVVEEVRAAMRPSARGDEAVSTG